MNDLQKEEIDIESIVRDSREQLSLISNEIRNKFQLEETLQGNVLTLKGELNELEEQLESISEGLSEVVGVLSMEKKEQMNSILKNESMETNSNKKFFLEKIERQISFIRDHIQKTPLGQNIHSDALELAKMLEQKENALKEYENFKQTVTVKL